MGCTGHNILKAVKSHINWKKEVQRDEKTQSEGRTLILLTPEHVGCMGQIGAAEAVNFKSVSDFSYYLKEGLSAYLYLFYTTCGQACLPSLHVSMCLSSVFCIHACSCKGWEAFKKAGVQHQGKQCGRLNSVFPPPSAPFISDQSKNSCSFV